MHYFHFIHGVALLSASRAYIVFHFYFYYASYRRGRRDDRGRRWMGLRLWWLLPLAFGRTKVLSLVRIISSNVNWNYYVRVRYENEGDT